MPNLDLCEINKMLNERLEMKYNLRLRFGTKEKYTEFFEDFKNKQAMYNFLNDVKKIKTFLSYNIREYKNGKLI